MPVRHVPSTAANRAVLRAFAVASAAVGTTNVSIALLTNQTLPAGLLLFPPGLALVSVWLLRRGSTATPLLLLTIVVLIIAAASRQRVLSFEWAGMGVAAMVMGIALMTSSRRRALIVAGLSISVLSVLRWGTIDEPLQDFVASVAITVVVTVFGVQLIEWAKIEISGRTRRFDNLFDNVPVAIWEEDFSGVAKWLDQLRTRGVVDLRSHFEANPDEIRHGASLIEIYDVNDEVLTFLEAFDRRSLVGPLDPKLILEDTLAAMVEQFVAVWEGRPKLRVDVTGTTLLGNPIDGFLMMSAPEGRGRPDWSRVVVAMVDLKEQRAVQHRLEELIDSKDQFVASVSHELRTPLAAVIGLAQELRQDPDGFSDAERNELVEVIADQATDVGNIVEDLLVAARADIGKVSIFPEPVEIGDEIHRIVATTGDWADRSYSIDASGVVIADPRRLRQIIRNLVTNARRYGGPSVVVATSRMGDLIQLEVRDNGTGIPEELHERVFEPYQTAHETVGITGSVGLGLTVSRQLAQLMHGSLTYERVDGWTVFRLSLPAA